MNTLSWLIYAADVSGNLDGLLWWLSCLSMIGVILWAIVGICAGNDDEFGPGGWLAWRRIGFYLLIPLFFASWIIGSIVPSKETVYAIAASEMGERAVNTTTGGKAVKALDKWLDKQIGDDSAAVATNNTQDK